MTDIKILYSDESIAVIHKPAGMLSIPGRGTEKSDSAATRLQAAYPGCIEQPSVHRLDMDTSGIMIFALTTEAHRSLSIQFQNAEVKKEYTAILEGNPADGIGESGRIELRFRLDPENRPHQIYDPVQGKTGVTIWKKLGIEADGRSRISFTPITGRTHQLRLHASHPLGLDCPIAGDRLYGSSSDADHKNGERMMLHACKIEFTHPGNGALMKFESPAPF
ncbi:MAG: RluA family pseudouridine synthase [Spirochaetales bacterium]|uniref:RluA family pseudouridine synthase n=1 Tax=Candidatus Thalassospirochaeta sargassi TaxID=3119039 RepID=A0AAJ1IAK0_9SPIO|nr:RluA family pseudouridine synthase [Spirochaetales bacterium]